MSANALNTYQAVKTLKAAGVGEHQAEAIVSIMNDSIGENLAIKDDLGAVKQELRQELKGVRQELRAVEQKVGVVEQKLGAVEQDLRQEFKQELGAVRQEFKQDMKLMEHRLTVRLGSLMIAMSSLIIAAVKVF